MKIIMKHIDIDELINELKKNQKNENNFDFYKYNNTYIKDFYHYEDNYNHAPEKKFIFKIIHNIFQKNDYEGFIKLNSTISKVKKLYQNKRSSKYKSINDDLKYKNSSTYLKF